MLSSNHPLATNSLSLTWKKQLVTGLDKRREYSVTPFKNNFIIFAGAKTETLFGGFEHTTPPINDLLLVNLEKNTTNRIEVSGDQLQARIGQTACLYKSNQLIIFGGEPQTAYPIGETVVLTLDSAESLSVQCKSIRTGGWVRHLSRAFHTADIFEDHMYVFGGAISIQPNMLQSVSNIYKPSNQLIKLNLNTFEWSECKTTGDLPSKNSDNNLFYGLYIAARYKHYSVLHYNKLYISPGEPVSPQSTGTDMHVIDLTTYKWEKISFKLQEPRPFDLSFKCAQIVDDKIYHFAQGEKPELQYLCIYDIFTGNWRKLCIEEKGPGVSSPQVICHQGEFIVFGDVTDYNIYSIEVEGLENMKSDSKGAVITEQNEVTLKGKDQSHLGNPKDLFLDKRNSDITFVIEDRELPGHKNILISRCKFFENMFSSGMSQSDSSKIEIKDVSFSTFKALLEFIYCNEIVLDYALAMDLLRVSDQYGFVELKNVCEKFLGQHLSLDNYVNIANASEQFKTVLLKDAVIQFLIKNRDVLYQKEEACEISKSLLWEVIFKIGKK